VLTCLGFPHLRLALDLIYIYNTKLGSKFSRYITHLICTIVFIYNCVQPEGFLVCAEICSCDFVFNNKVFLTPIYWYLCIVKAMG